MPKLSKIFPSRFVAAIDLEGREVPATIDHVEVETFDDGSRKPLIYFVGWPKALVANVTNSRMIAEITGADDTDDWPGKDIILYATLVDYKGKTVEAIRVRRPPEPTADDDMADSIPF